MMYHGTYTSETIELHPIGQPDELHYIELTKSATEPTFFATCCCDPHWYYEFYMENNSDYERVKMAIMDMIFECDEMVELLDVLSEIFEDGFADILVENNDDCDGDCEHCECNKYLN